MIERTNDIATSLILIVTTLAFALATGCFMVVGIGTITQQTFGSMNNLLVTLFLIFVTGLLFFGSLKVFSVWTGFLQENDVIDLEGETGSRRSVSVLQTKKGSTSCN